MYIIKIFKMKWNILKPTKQHSFNKQVYGFDIETYDDNKKFLMASIHDGKNCNIFYDKDELITEFKRSKYQRCYVSATNLAFDFFGAFYKKEDLKHFNFLWRGSDLIYSKTKLKKGILYKHGKNMDSLTFIDTMNYVKLSVNDLGKIMNLPKLKSPDFIGKYPKDKAEWDEMIKYNIRDSQISQKVIHFFYDSFSHLGATPKLTIASTSMSLWRNQYLKEDYFRHETRQLLEQFNAYYGGNVHVYARGKLEDYNYYDFNSLYPSVMRNDFPNPNSMKITNENTTSFIEVYEGVSSVELSCPYMEYPLLPLRYDGKLIFPYGNFKGWYSHVELRKAVELGYTIKKVNRTYYFTETCIPFRDYVEDLYNLRKDYKAKNNPMEIVVKLLMNSLYGKFGQKFLDKEQWQVFDHTVEELKKYTSFERIGEFIRLKKHLSEPAVFCIPIWALYVTAFARLKLHEWILRTNPVYVDTDSLITKKKLPNSSELGKLKLESTIDRGIIVRPKFYMIEGFDGDMPFNNYKIKGMGVKIDRKIFLSMMINPSYTYKKFMKFKESVRRGFIPNEIIDMTKEMSLEDNKRIWQKEFDYNEFQTSRPIEMIDGVSELDIDNQAIENKIEVGY